MTNVKNIQLTPPSPPRRSVELPQTTEQPSRKGEAEGEGEEAEAQHHAGVFANGVRDQDRAGEQKVVVGEEEVSARSARSEATSNNNHFIISSLVQMTQVLATISPFFTNSPIPSSPPPHSSSQKYKGREDWGG